FAICRCRVLRVQFATDDRRSAYAEFPPSPRLRPLPELRAPVEERQARMRCRLCGCLAPGESQTRRSPCRKEETQHLPREVDFETDSCGRKPIIQIAARSSVAV